MGPLATADQLVHLASVVLRATARDRKDRQAQAVTQALRAVVAVRVTTAGLAWDGLQSKLWIRADLKLDRCRRFAFVPVGSQEQADLMLERLFTQDVRDKTMETETIPICRFNVNGVCTISTELAGMEVPIAADACRACIAAAHPQAINRVTCSKAIHTRLIHGLPPTPKLLECVSPPQRGVGTELERMIAVTRRWLAWIGLGWILPEPGTAECGCQSLRTEMNLAGPVGCLDHRERYAQNMFDRWCSHAKIVGRIPGARSITGFYIKQAIRKARSKEIK